jgi:hypothetical protein
MSNDDGGEEVFPCLIELQASGGSRLLRFH